MGEGSKRKATAVISDVWFLFILAASVGVRKFSTRQGIKALPVLLLFPFEAEKITFEAREKKKLARIH